MIVLQVVQFQTHKFKTLNKGSAIMKNRGFSLLEIIIAITVLSILSYGSYSSFRQYLIDSNEAITKHQLVRAMHDLEKYYAKNGAYSSSSSVYPTTVMNRLSGFNNQYYTFSMYPINPQSNAQVACIEAIPKTSTIQKDSSLLVIDNSGRVSNSVPAVCNVFHPAQGLCLDSNGQLLPYSTKKDFPGCGIDDGSHVGSGNCDGARLNACSGNCNSASVCGPLTIGCSGNCDNTFILNSACSGNCASAYIYINGSQLANGAACNGDCNGTTFDVPSSWMGRQLSCTEGSGKLCICTYKGSASKCADIKVIYH